MGDSIVLGDLGAAYDLTDLATATDNIETLDISDGTDTTLTVSSQDVQNMVDNGDLSELTIRTDVGDTLDISLTGTQESVAAAHDTHTDYTIYTDASHTVQVAQIHWEVIT